MGACTYYPDIVAQHIPVTGNLIEDSKTFEQAVESGNQALKDLRQASKNVTFKLAYQGMADSDRGGVITPEMYDNYHNNLYPGVRSYIDNYVLPTAESDKRLHLALGLYLHTDSPSKDYRTLHNATTIKTVLSTVQV